MATLVYRNGVKATWKSPDLMVDQIRKAHNLSNKMVEIEHSYLEAIAAAWREHPDVAAAEDVTLAAVDKLEAVAAEIRSARVANRSTESTAEAKAAIKAARDTVRAARADLKAAKTSVKDILKPKLDEASKGRQKARVAARKAAVDDGLFWATATDILRKAVAAEKLIANAWKSGRKAERRFKRWDGTGTITTQIMWSAGMPPLTPAYLASEKSPRRNVIQLTPYFSEADWPKGRGEHRKGKLKLQIAKGQGNVIEIPVALHRPLPDDGEVKQVAVTRRRIGTQFRTSVQFTVNVPDPEPKEDGVPVSVTIHWDQVPEGLGAIRVAEIHSQFINFNELPVPAEIADVVIPGEDENTINVIVPAQWRAHLDDFAGIRALRSDLLNIVRPLVVKWLSENPEFAESLEVKAADVDRWRSHHKFQWLATKFPADLVLDNGLHRQLLKKMLSFKAHKNETPEHYKARLDKRRAKLEALGTFQLWRLRDRHLEDYEAHGSAQLFDRRRHKYRNVVAWICGLASMIALDAPPVAAIKRIPSVEKEDTHADRASRAQAHIAAPGELASFFTHGARRRGITVIDSRAEESE